MNPFNEAFSLCWPADSSTSNGSEEQSEDEDDEDDFRLDDDGVAKPIGHCTQQILSAAFASANFPQWQALRRERNVASTMASLLASSSARELPPNFTSRVSTYLQQSLQEPEEVTPQPFARWCSHVATSCAGGVQVNTSYPERSPFNDARSCRAKGVPSCRSPKGGASYE